MDTQQKTASFKVKRIIFAKTLKQLNTYLPNKKGRNRATCELTIIKDHISLTVPGSTLALEVETCGAAKATFDLFKVIDIVKMFTEKELTISVSKEHVNINSFSFRTMTTLFEDDRILRSVVLPVNYSDIDLVSISASKLYTEEELKFNNLWILVNQAETRLRSRINAAKRELSYYQITKEEIEELVNQKIRIHIESIAKSHNLQAKIQSKSS